MLTVLLVQHTTTADDDMLTFFQYMNNNIVLHSWSCYCNLDELLRIGRAGTNIISRRNFTTNAATMW